MTVLAFLYMGTHALLGQSTLNKANKQYELYAFNLAAKTYKAVLERQPNNAFALARLADCYYYLNRLHEACTYYSRAIEAGQTTSDIYFRYGQALKGIEKYEEARRQFERYSMVYAEAGSQFANSCNYALTHKNDPPAYQVKREYLNTNAADFAPSFFKGKVVFASSREDLLPKGKNVSHWTGSSRNMLFLTEPDPNGFLKSPKPLHSSLRTSWNEGPLCYSSDGRWVAFTKNNFTEGTRQIRGTGIELSLFIAEVKGEGDWENATPFEHNGSDFSTGYPCFSADGQALYFASDRPGGFGGFDLYVSYKTPTGWSVPENLGDGVNTPGDEISPFVLGTTLYFASDWHPGFGGYDVFKAEVIGRSFGQVENLGPGVNSSRDDYGLVFDKEQGRGYLYSNRIGGEGFEDIYRLSEASGNLVIRVYNASSGEVIPDATVDLSACGLGSFTTNLSGTYSMRIKPGFTCNITVKKDGYVPYSFNLTSLVQGQGREVEVQLRKLDEQYLGRVVDAESKAPLDQVYVTATNQATGAKMEASTDYRGEYALALAPNASYLIRYSRAGYMDVSRVVRTRDTRQRDVLGEVALVSSTSAAARQPDSYNSTSSWKAPNIQHKTPDEYAAEESGPKVLPAGYAVQLAAFKKGQKYKMETFSALEEVGTIYTYEEKNMEKVRVGIFSSIDEAKYALRKAKAAGFSSAFVIRQKEPVNLGGEKAQQDSELPTEYDAAQQQPKTPLPSGKKEEKKSATTASPYLVQLAAYRNTKYFDKKKVLDIGVLEQRERGDLTIMLLSGYDSLSDAKKALYEARKRGFKGAYVVVDQDGKLKRVN